MPERAPPARRRRWPRVLGLLLAATVLALFVAHRLLRPHSITAWLVEQVRSGLGAELHLDGDGEYAFSPMPRALLPRPSLASGGATLLRADALRVSLPWRTLWSRRIEIERIELVRPVVDLDAVHAWLAQRPTSTAPLPDVRVALHIDDGTLLRGGVPFAEGVTIDIANSDDIAAWLARWDGTPAALLPPVAGSIGVRTLKSGDVTVEGLRVEIHDDDAH